jgi:hypothetical protein
MGLLALERPRALAEAAPSLPAGGEVGAPANQDEAGLLLAGLLLDRLPGLQPLEIEPDMAPAGARGRHPVDEAVTVGVVVPEQQLGRHPPASLATSRS